MTQVSKMDPWFSPKAVGSGFGEPISKEPTYALSGEAESRFKKSSRRPNGYQPKPGEGAGVRTDLCPPITHPSRVVMTPVEPWGGGGGVKMSLDSLTNFASCQSSQAKPRPRHSWDL